jgi:hypothetical protein
MCRIDGPLDLDALQGALHRVVAAHVALRTTFVPGRTLRQLFHGSLPAQLDLQDLTQVDEPGAAAIVRRELATRIDPTVSPLRATLFKLQAGSHLLVLNVHHLVTDLWSSNVLFEDLLAALRCPTEPLGKRHAGWDSVDFSRWERDQLSRGAFARQQRYWFERLAGMSPIPAGLAPARADAHGSTERIDATIDAYARRALEALAVARQASPFSVLLAVAFAGAFLETGQRDLSIASLFANRSKSELEHTVAFLVNLLILRIRIGSTPRFVDFVDQSQRAVSGALLNADLPYHALSPKPLRAPGHDQLRADDLVFHVATDQIDRVHEVGPLTVSAQVPEVVGRFDLELAVRPAGDSLAVRLSYNPKRIERRSAQLLVQRYVDAGRMLAHSPEAVLAPLLAGAESGPSLKSG